MGDDAKVAYSAETVRVGQKWRGGSPRHIYEIVHVTDKEATLLYEGKNYSYKHAVLKRALVELVEDVNPHDFSDRYCSVGFNGETHLACLACGAVQGMNDSTPCKPNPGWRVVAEQWMCVMDNASIKPWDAYPQPGQQFRYQQAHALRAGGVFSLRDEDHERRRRPL